eukprot:jgi/Astpho2/2234/Aster-03215
MRVRAPAGGILVVCQCTDLLQLKECLVRAHRATCFSSSCNLLVKNIHQQQSEHMVTGSFKSRGACNKLLSLTDEELAKGIVTSSTGNHALAVLYACQQVSRVRQLAHPVQPIVFLPHNISTAKMDQLQQQGAQTVQHGTDCVEAELQAKAWAHQTGAVYISPYNDLQVSGQGTIAIELLEQVPDLGTVYVPVGGGGLIAGIAAVLKGTDRGIRVVGCQPEASAVMMQSVRAGRIIEAPSLQTLSDGTAGGVEEGTITFEPCATLVDHWVVVSEADIAAAMVRVEAEHAIRIEGSAGVAVAVMQLDKHSGSKKARVAICCGSNVSVSSWSTASALAGTT